jgi:sporulation inhibitor KapD
MNVVVFDLETLYCYKKGDIAHIVEIGACKVNLINEEIIDTFQIYVQPKGVKVNKTTRKFIKASEEDFVNGMNTTEAINKFWTWLGHDYYLCSWSDSELKILVEQSGRFGFSLNWLKNYNDVQKPISKALRDDGKVVGLKKALQIAGISFEGKRHSGLYDSINTANLMFKYKNFFRLRKNDPSENYAMTSLLYKRCNECEEMKYFKNYKIHKGKYINKCKICFYEYQNKNRENNIKF